MVLASPHPRLAKLGAVRVFRKVKEEWWGEYGGMIGLITHKQKAYASHQCTNTIGNLIFKLKTLTYRSSDETGKGSVPVSVWRSTFLLDLLHHFGFHVWLQKVDFAVPDALICKIVSEIFSREIIQCWHCSQARRRKKNSLGLNLAEKKKTSICLFYKYNCTF